MTLSGLQPALAAWADAIGAEHVTDAPDLVAAANRATLSAPSSIVAMLSPDSPAETAACLRIATQFRVAVHPVSRGCNWGYGSRLPPRHQAVLLSLARMDRVLRLDEQLATVRIEPGVTFAALARHLSQCGSGLLPPSTGSGPHTSVLGNVMERGIGKGLYEDMAAHACGFEVVLPSGSIVHTGPAAPLAVAGVAPFGPGPGLRDLFVQANLGVVTAMDFWLHPAPRLRQIAWTTLPDNAALAACVDRLRPLLLRADPRLRAEIVSTQRAATQGVPVALGGWIAVVRLWADSEAELAPRRAAALTALGDARAGPLEPGNHYEMDDIGLLGAYAAKPHGMPADPDPDRDRCGVVWVAPHLPFLGVSVAAAAAAAAGVLEQQGFPFAMSLRQATGRAVQAVIGLFYDRDEPGGDARAAAASSALHRWMADAGLAPYRLGILEMGDPALDPAGRRPWDAMGGRTEMLQAIKRVVDPAGILSPGRYIP